MPAGSGVVLKSRLRRYVASRSVPDFARWLATFEAEYPWLPDGLALHYGRLYGTRAEGLLAGADGMADLGRHFGADLYERELRYLARAEWAESAQDILERRTKHGLHLSVAQKRALELWLQRERPTVDA